jgi:hypothetical protein
MKKNVIFDHYIGETVGESKIDWSENQIDVFSWISI